MKTSGILLVLLCASGIPAAAEEPIFSSLADARSPGAAVLVRRNGRTLFQHGYGVRDLRTFARIDPKTNFRLASFTKQFTAMAAMLLVHDGKLRYDQPVTSVFPDFPAYGRAITIRHLLTHTSGLTDYEELMGAAPAWTSTHQIQDEEVLGLLRRAAPKFAPGTNWAYSNSGYVLLGLIIARVSGEPFGQFLHERIFKPVAYGFGWFLDPYRGRPRMWHGGSTLGFRTAIERFPRERLTVIVLCNRTDLDAPALALRAAEAFPGSR